MPLLIPISLFFRSLNSEREKRGQQMHRESIEQKQGAFSDRKWAEKERKEALNVKQRTLAGYR